MIFFVLRGSMQCLHFVLRYYCTVRDFHCSRSEMEWKSLLSRVWRPVSIVTPSPKARSAPAVILEPVEAFWSRQGTSEAPKTDFLMKITVYFGRNSWPCPTMDSSQKTCPSGTSTPDLVDEFRNVIEYFFSNIFL